MVGHLLTSACSYNVFILEVVGFDLKHDLKKNSGINLGHDLGSVPEILMSRLLSAPVRSLGPSSILPL
jgi:hypothetical protein